MQEEIERKIREIEEEERNDDDQIPQLDKDVDFEVKELQDKYSRIRNSNNYTNHRKLRYEIKTHAFSLIPASVSLKVNFSS